MRNKLIVLALFLVVCGSVYGMGEKKPVPPTVSPATVGDFLMSGPAEDFTLKDLSGNAHTLSGHRGKIVFLHFFRSMCHACQVEMPSIQKLYDALDKDKYVLLTVSIKEEENIVNDFAIKNNITFPVLLDLDGKITDNYKVNLYPTTFIIGKEGDLLTKIVGSREWSADSLEKFVK